MKRRVEDGHLRDVRKGCASTLDAVERRSVVEGRELRQRDQFALHLVIDQDGVAESLASVHDPVGHRAKIARNGVERGDQLCRVTWADP